MPIKMHNPEIYINGIGVLSPYGDSLASFWSALLQPFAPAHANQTNFVQSDFIDLCVQAVKKTMEDCRTTVWRESGGCLLLGTGMGLAGSYLSPSISNSSCKQLLKDRLLSQFGVNLEVIILTNACCAGAQAISYGYDLLKSGRYSYVIAGGVEPPSEITTNGFKRLNSLDNACCKPFDKNRKGIVPGVGAALFFLQTEQTDTSYCRLCGHATTNDAYSIVAPDPSGTWAALAITTALDEANLLPDEIDAVVAHGTGTKTNDQVESEILYRIFGAIDTAAPKSVTGHTGGASGAFGVLTAAGALYNQQLPAISTLTELDPMVRICPLTHPKQKIIRHVLVDTFAFGGTNTVLICGGLLN